MTIHSLIAIASLLSIGMFYACGSSPSLEDFDRKLWLQDNVGCEEHRKYMQRAIVEQQQKIIKLTENEIIDLLGIPNTKNLYQHNQKAYIYYTSSHCDKKNTIVEEQLIFYFNALGLCKEVSIL